MGQFTHKLTDEHQIVLCGWIAEGLSDSGVQARIEAHNKRLPEDEEPFPTLSRGGIHYWRDKLGVEIDAQRRLLNKRRTESIATGLRNRDVRVDRLIQAAEVLEPYLATRAPQSGRFTASEQYLKILAEIRAEVGDETQSELSAADFENMSVDQLFALAAAARGAASA